MHTSQFQTIHAENPCSFQSKYAVGSVKEKTMKAIVQRSYGTADVLKHEIVDIPTPGEKEVLIEVHAAALDRGDAAITDLCPVRLLARMSIGHKYSW